MKYAVHVSNIGLVLETNSLKQAKRTFDNYVEQSQAEIGRAGMESVWIIKGDDILKEHTGKLYLNADY